MAFDGKVQTVINPMANAERIADRKRLAAIDSTGVLDRVGDHAFERLVELARRLTRSEVALVSLVRPDEQVFLGQAGLSEPWASCRRTPLSHSFCKHVVDRAQPLVVSDARKTPLVASNLAIRDLNVIAYLGVPLVTPDGQVIGSLCAIESRPRDWTDEDVDSLTQLATSVITEIAIQYELDRRIDAERTRDILFDELNHRIRNLFQLVLGLVRNEDADHPEVQRFQSDITARLTTLAQAHSLVFENTSPQDPESGGADLGILADAILMPLPGSDRIRREGDPVQLSSRQSLYAALLFHELGTNAIKHGALSVPEGAVALSWRDAGDEVHIDWVETKGPKVHAPNSRGFGSDLIEILTAGSRREDSRVSFDSGGMMCCVGLPVS